MKSASPASLSMDTLLDIYSCHDQDYRVELEQTVCELLQDQARWDQINQLADQFYTFTMS